MKKGITFLCVKASILIIAASLLLAGCLAVNLQDIYRRRVYGVARGVYLDNIPVENMLTEEVRFLLETRNKKTMIKPGNAYLDPMTGLVLPETYGLKMDVSATLKQVMAAKPQTVITPVFVTLDPEITADVFRELNLSSSSFTTYYGGGGRGENIRLAASSLHNYYLAPGEVFSFNSATGPRTAERGYKLAPIIVGGTVIPGYGGGVCQVSSTLYNAVLNAGLDIVERFPHSRPVDYVPGGRDATVSNHLDFKFRNSRDRFIIIKTSAYHYRLTIEIWE